LHEESTLTPARATTVNSEASEGRRRFAWVVAACVPFIVLAVTSLGFVRDDWEHYANMRALWQSVPLWQAVTSIVDNSWFGAHEPRLFFLSFLVHFFIAPFGNAAPSIAYTYITLLHVGACLLANRVVFYVTRQATLAAAIALLLLLNPLATQAVFFLNNLFFVQPWFFLTLTVFLLVRPTSVPTHRTTALICVAALACQFSGECTLFALYLVLVTFVLKGWFQWHRHGAPHAFTRAVLPSLVCAVSLFIYIGFVVKRPHNQPLTLNYQALYQYLAQAYRVSIQFFTPFSERYGHGGISASVKTYAATLASGLAAFFAVRPSNSTAEQPTKNVWGISAGAILLGMAAVGVMFVGVITNVRPGVEPRYLYFPGQLAIIAAASAAWLPLALFPFGPRRFHLVVCLVVLWFASLSFYSLNDIWAEQRRVDAALWTALDKFVGPHTRYIVTFNPNHSYLMAPYHSNAVSDFQADWGIGGRLWWRLNTAGPITVARDARLNPDGLLDLYLYYGGAPMRIRQPVATPDTPLGGFDTVYVTYDYGPRFVDLKNSRLRIFTDFSAYDEDVREILTRHPGVYRVMDQERTVP
jgi:hypothetical protein